MDTRVKPAYDGVRGAGETKMAHYRLHCNGGSGHSYKIALYLSCAGLEWEPVGVDFAGGQTRDLTWRAATNIMGEVPVLEVDGKRMSQSAAILLWLAETTGKFAPTGEQHFEAMRWLFFDNHKFTNNYAMHRFQNSLTPEPVHPAVLAFLRSRVESSFAIPSSWVSVRPSSISLLPGTSITPPRRPASILRRSIRRSMAGGGALPRWPGGSRRTR